MAFNSAPCSNMTVTTHSARFPSVPHKEMGHTFGERHIHDPDPGSFPLPPDCYLIPRASIADMELWG